MPLTEPLVRDLISRASARELELVWIPKIMQNQEEDEIQSEHTKHSNGKGLTGADAPRITYYHRMIQDGGHLGGKQIEIARQRLLKYSKQYSQMSKATGTA